MAIAAAVMAGLQKLPREAVPETLEIVMQATGVGSVTLLSSLLRSAPAKVEEAQRFEVEAAGAEAETPNLIAYVAALLYLLKDSAQDDDVVDKVVWTICIPLLRIQNPKLSPLQAEVIKMMVNTVEVLELWRSMAKTLGRICHQTFITTPEMQTMAGMKREESQFLSNSCELVGALLKSAMEVTQETTSSTILNRDTLASAKYFCIEVVNKFLEPALAFLSQPHQTFLRHLAISTLLPPILRTITKLGVTSVTSVNLISSEMPEISRSTTVQQIWGSCKILFKHGHMQRRDAHVALAVFAEYLLPPVQLKVEPLLLQRIPKKFEIDYFDIRNDPFFWDELKAGLAHDDPLIRERALYVLKKAVLNYSGRPDDPNDRKLREDCTTGNIRFERWSAFVFLYEMLDMCEGFHLAEGILTQKISFLLPFSKPKSGEKRPWANPGIRSITEGVDVDFKWMSVLFQRGFNHEIIRVRQMVLRSFLELDWTRAPKVKAFVPEEFVLGTFLSSLDDPVQHEEFDQGLSDLSTLAAKFIRSYSASLSVRNRKRFVQRFAKVFAAKAPCRAGLMSFAVCLDAATVELIGMEAEFSDRSKEDSISSSTVASEDEGFLDLDYTPSNLNEIGSDVLDSLQLVVEKSRNYFDQEYGAKVYEHILVAAAAMNQVPFILVSKLAKFITCFPREFLQQGGCLHDSLIKWIHPSPNGHSCVYPRLNSEEWLRRGLTIMMEEYLRWGKPNCTESLLCKDELRSWEETAQRWTRLVAVSAVSNETQQQIVLLVERCLTEIYQRAYMVPRVAEKTLLLFRCLLKECETWACAEYNAHVSPSSSTNNDDDYCSSSRLTQYVADTLLNTLDVLAQNAKKSTGIFWEYHESSVLRVPFPTEARSQDIERSQGSSVTASAVMQGVLATTTLAEGCIWYCRLRGAADIPEGIINFFWDFAWKVVTTPAAQTEAGAEVQLGSYEALVTVCGAWAATVSPRVVSKPMAQVLEKDPFVALTAATVVENLVVALSTNVQVILRRGLLTKLQCEALACYKASEPPCCHDSFLVIWCTRGYRNLEEVTHRNDTIVIAVVMVFN
ncbi:hypothetical protein M758_3G162800 [Ceratodon purpureus]|nr:hypothetical protein M758_3G162800 [Ceratodon purpureus]